MRHSRIDQREQSLLAQSHFIEYLLRDVNQLNHVVFFIKCLNRFLAHLNINKLLLISRLHGTDHLINIACDFSRIHCEEIFQRIGLIFSHSQLRVVLLLSA